MSEQTYEPGPLERALAAIFGAERARRWIEAADNYLSEPQGAVRCPWRTPADRERCVRRIGHKGSCATFRFVTNVQEGKTSREVDYWRGINYRINGDTSDLTWVHGPYPVEVDQAVEVTAGQSRALRQFQRESRITADGVLGPQTWVLLSKRNDEEQGR